MSSIPLLTGFFETAYVTRDMTTALDVIARRDGVTRFHVFAPPATRGAVSHLSQVAKAYVGDRMLEIVQPNPDVKTIYEGFVPARENDLRLHHLGYLVQDDAHWQAIRDSLQQSGIDIAYEGHVPGLIRVMYADTRAQLGHYSEYLQNYEGGRELMSIIPRN